MTGTRSSQTGSRRSTRKRATSSATQESSSTEGKKKKPSNGTATANSDLGDLDNQDPLLYLLDEHWPSAEQQHVAKSEQQLERKDYASAAQTATKVLADAFSASLPTLAKAALLRGRALKQQAMEEMERNGGEQPSPEVLDQMWNAFGLSSRLNPDCEETEEELDFMSKWLGELTSQKNMLEIAAAAADGCEEAPPDVDVLVVGAGAAGVGCALMLVETFRLDPSRVLLVEQGDHVGESFRRWPAEMRFISPSFNQQGWSNSFDLNSISHGTSPAYSLHSEHPSGTEYAKYLEAIVKTKELQVRKRTKVMSIRPVQEQEQQGGDEHDEDNEEEGDKLPLFSVNVRTTPAGGREGEFVSETLSARYIVWAAGEFQYPRRILETKQEQEEEENKATAKGDNILPGSELCLHNSQVRSWAKIPGNDFLIIGGYESGLDAAINLARAGKQCQVLASTPYWSVKTVDPSAELAPYTAARLREVTSPHFHGPRPRLLAPLRVVKIEKATTGKGGFHVTAEWKALEEVEQAPLREPVKINTAQEPGKEGSTLVLHTPHPPILCTGFEGSVAAVASHLFAFAGDDHPRKGCLGDAPLLTEDDESTIVPGVFLVGPSVQHDSLSFCFIYKFRQRFAVVANAICRGLGIDTKGAVADCRQTNMYLDNFETCQDTCGDVC